MMHMATRNYMVQFEIGADDFVSAMAMARDMVLGEAPVTVVSIVPNPNVRVSVPSRTARESMTWSVNAPADLRGGGGVREVTLAFDGRRERMGVSIYTPLAESQITTAWLKPEDAASVVRAMRLWPLDLIDSIVARDRGGVG